MQRIDLGRLDESGDIQGLAEECGALDPTGSTRRNLVKNGAIGGFGAGIAMFGLLDPVEAIAAATSKQKGKYSTSLKRVKRTARKPTTRSTARRTEPPTPFSCTRTKEAARGRPLASSVGARRGLRPPWPSAALPRRSPP